MTATGSYTENAWTNKNVDVSLTANDNAGGTGVKEIRYTTDGTAPTKTTGNIYTGSIPVTSTTTVKYLAVDNAGNAEAVNSFQVNIDKSNPTYSCTPLTLLLGGRRIT
jgi:Chitobiase/beta-hexosaminidase C-terminal domain